MSARKVLVVEDDAVGRQILFTALRHAGYETTVAADAVAALALTQRHKPDAIVLDLGLPGGGGFTFLERVGRIPALSTIPVVVVSGQKREESEPRARAAGAVMYFEKPASPETIVQAVRDVAGDPRP